MKLRQAGSITLSSLALLAALPASAQDITRADEILDRFRNSEAHGANILVVAHRGAAFENGEEVVAENSLASLNRAVDLGVDLVEVDVRRTGDGVFVVLHDKTLDRATDCEGAVAEKRYDEIAGCHLLQGAERVVTDETIPTLETYLDAAKGRIMINLDNKVGADAIGAIYDVVEAAGMEDYAVTTISAHTPEDLEVARSVQDTLGEEVQLMPNVYDSKIPGPQQITAIYDALDFEVMQVRNARPDPADPLTEDGGALMTDEARALADQNDVHLWINTLSTNPDEPDMRAGGRGDVLARSGDLDGSYGFWAEHGATMLQTDEPALAIQYLQEHGYREPFAAMPMAAE